MDATTINTVLYLPPLKALSPPHLATGRCVLSPDSAGHLALWLFKAPANRPNTQIKPSGDPRVWCCIKSHVYFLIGQSLKCTHTVQEPRA